MQLEVTDILKIFSEGEILERKHLIGRFEKTKYWYEFKSIELFQHQISEFHYFNGEKYEIFFDFEIKNTVVVADIVVYEYRVKPIGYLKP